MIIEKQSLSMAESLKYLKNAEESAEVVGFIKKFTDMKPEQAKEIREEIRKLNLNKIKEEHISKIIDLMPENSVDLNKIFVDVSLDDNESNKILDIIKGYK